MNVYAIQDGAGFVKFGITGSEPSSRMSDMQTGNAQALGLVGYSSHEHGATFEGHLHRALECAGLRERGEWFKPSAVTTCISVAIASDEMDEAMRIAIDAAIEKCNADGGHDGGRAGVWLKRLLDKELCPCCMGKVWRDGVQYRDEAEPEFRNFAMALDFHDKS